MDKGYRARTKDGAQSVFIGWYPNKEDARAAVDRYRKRKGLPTTREDLIRKSVARRITKSVPPKNINNTWAKHQKRNQQGRFAK